MLTIEIVNDGTGKQKSANYKYTVRVNDEVIEQGEVKGHDRGNGWKDLVLKMLDIQPTVSGAPATWTWQVMK